MNEGVADFAGMDRSQRVDSLLAAVRSVLTKLGIDEVTPDSVIAAPRFYDAPVLFQDTDRLDQFLLRFALKARFAGYSSADVAFLSVRELCELYLSDSFPETPSVPLSDDQVWLGDDGVPERPGVNAKEFPICFVLGSARSGTTLFRTMLNVHDEMWAPGELHLANFDGMADRARNIIPILRFMPIPELASRFGESVASFARGFRRWELENLSISETYENVYRADPARLIVDKTPTYSARLRDLERIGQQFPNARFVHLVRSPHDVIRSFVRMQLYKGSVGSVEPGLNPHHIAEVVWTVHNANIEAFFSGLPNERKCTVHYEELVSDTETPLKRVCDLLGLPFDPEMADPYKKSPGRIAMGAGDVRVNFARAVESRKPIEAFYPIGTKCRTLADRFGY